MINQLNCHPVCLVAKMGKAIDYHYFATEAEFEFRKKDLIKKGFEVTEEQTGLNKKMLVLPCDLPSNNNTFDQS